MSRTELAIAIEGQAGAGKTPLIEALGAEFSKLGIRTIARAPFAQANAIAAARGRRIGIYEDWGYSAQSARDAEKLLRGLVDGAVQEARSSGALLILDRGWLTVCRGVEDSAMPEEERRELCRHWTESACPSFFLDTTPEITQSRASWRPDLPWTNELIGRDFQRRRELADSSDRILARCHIDRPRADLQAIARAWALCAARHLGLIHG